MDCFKGVGPEASLKSQDLGRLQEVLQRSMKARKSVFTWVNWKLFSKDKIFISRVLVANGLTNNRKGYKILEERVDNRLNIEHNITKLRSTDWLTGVPNSLDKLDFQTWFLTQKKAISAKFIYESIRGFKEYFPVQKMDFGVLRKQVESLKSQINTIPDHKQNWLTFLTNSQLNTLINEPAYSHRLLETLNREFDSLCEADRLKEKFSHQESIVVEKLLSEAEKITQDSIMGLFQNSMRLAWIDHIETKYPILRSVSSLKFEKMMEELQDFVKEKYEVSNEILLLKARERTYQHAEYNRLNNLVTYRDLHHQVTKKRRVWPIRKLIQSFDEELFNLIPCWMGSPESVSTIFPMEEIFDVVIFDEASQCFVERGIPAMYRGNQVVIAGDSKQLKPNDLYQIRWEEDAEDEIPELEIDSLLDLASKHLMKVQLQGHYRSKSLDLIDFSNRNFYEGKLKLLPDFDDVTSGIPGVKYIKVDGVWEDNVNQAEADQVIDLVEHLLNENPKKEIGIVTFNAKQQFHIMDKLDEAVVLRKLKIPESLIVKNIENIQGDEKDVIIFSIGYAPNKQGKLSIKFGSLNAVGGENRLNVAITRARESVYLVTSIYPEQLQVEDARNEGPKLLKKYLKYAREISEGKFKPTPAPSNGYSSEWFLKNRLVESMSLKKEQIECIPELPFADLTLKKGGKYYGLILTDDDLYHQSVSIKDAHVYTPSTLTLKNWKFTKLTSRNFWIDRKGILDKLTRWVGLTVD